MRGKETEYRKKYAEALLLYSLENRSGFPGMASFGEGIVKRRIQEIGNTKRNGRQTILIVAIGMALFFTAGFEKPLAAGDPVPEKYMPMYHVICEKTEKTAWTAEQKAALAIKLMDDQFAPEDLKNVAVLFCNAEGKTFGADCLGADYIAIWTADGSDQYVKREDLEAGKSDSFIPAYNSDGTTIAGYFHID